MSPGSRLEPLSKAAFHRAVIMSWQIRADHFQQSFRQEQSSQLPAGLAPDSLAWHTAVFMPVPCILLHSHPSSWNMNLTLLNAPVMHFRTGIYCNTTLFTCCCPLNTLINSPCLIYSYSSFKTQLHHHTLCEAVIFATWKQGPALFIFLSPATTHYL